jgi:hypothetical protein
MQMTRRWMGSWTFAALLGLGALNGPLSREAQAASLEFSATLPSAPLSAGERFVVRGQLTNLTGLALQTSELALSFSGYDPLALQFTPLLGDPDISVPDRSISALLDLFETEILDDAMPGADYQFEWFAVDASGVFSPTYLGSVQLSPLNTVALPPALLLALLAGTLALKQRRRFLPSPAPATLR